MEENWSQSFKKDQTDTLTAATAAAADADAIKEN